MLMRIHELFGLDWRFSVKNKRSISECINHFAEDLVHYNGWKPGVNWWAKLEGDVELDDARFVELLLVLLARRRRSRAVLDGRLLDCYRVKFPLVDEELEETSVSGDWFHDVRANDAHVADVGLANWRVADLQSGFECWWENYLLARFGDYFVSFFWWGCWLFFA